MKASIKAKSFANIPLVYGFYHLLFQWSWYSFSILKSRIEEFMTIWSTDNLYWIPVTHTEETRLTGIMSLGERLGFEDEAAFLELRKRSGCSQFRSWKKHLGPDVITYEGKTFGVRWIAFGVHIAGPNGWLCCPDHYSRGKGLGKTKTLEFLEPEQCRMAYLPSRPITFPTKIADRLSNKHTSTEHYSNATSPDIKNNKVAHDCTSEKPTEVAATKLDDSASQKTDEKCPGLCSKRVDNYGAIDPSYCLDKWSYFHGRWRSKKCSLVMRENESKCASCSNANSNINRRSRPKLFSVPQMNEIFPKISSCDDCIRQLHTCRKSMCSGAVFLTI